MTGQYGVSAVKCLCIFTIFHYFTVCSIIFEVMFSVIRKYHHKSPPIILCTASLFPNYPGPIQHLSFV